MYPNRSVLLGALAALAVSCGECGVGEEFTVKKVVGIHTGTDETCQVDVLSYDLAQDETFARLRTLIGYGELRRVAVEIVNERTDPTSVATLASGTLRIGADETSTELVLGTWGEVPIVNGSGKEIEFDRAAADELIKLGLRLPNKFTVHSEGCVDQVPAFFDFRIDLTFFAGL
jgi:hypothetical protein